MPVAETAKLGVSFDLFTDLVTLDWWQKEYLLRGLVFLIASALKALFQI